MYWSNLSESSSSSGCSPYPVENTWSYWKKNFCVLYKVSHCGLKCMILRLIWRYNVFVQLTEGFFQYFCEFRGFRESIINCVNSLIFLISCCFEGLDLDKETIIFVCVFWRLWMLRSGNHSYFCDFLYTSFSCFLYILNFFWFLNGKCLHIFVGVWCWFHVR